MHNYNVLKGFENFIGSRSGGPTSVVTAGSRIFGPTFQQSAAAAADAADRPSAECTAAAAAAAVFLSASRSQECST